MQDFEQAYNQQGSRFSRGQAAAQAGSYSRFLDEASSNLDRFSGVMSNGFKAQKGTGAAEEDALSGALEQTNQGQLSSNLGRVQGQFGQQAQIGFQGVSNIQAAKQAKEMAAMGVASANQGATFSAISSGLGALGSIGGAFNWFRGGGGGGSNLDLSNLSSAWQFLK